MNHIIKMNKIRFYLYFIMGNKIEIYMRTYPKIQDALAIIGGISKAILMFFFYELSLIILLLIMI